MRKVVKKVIDETVMKIYWEGFAPFVFPADPVALIGKIYACDYRSYEQLAVKNKCRPADIVRILKNPDGCVFYDRKKNHYMIAANEEGRSPARIRWTIAHEIGHVVAGHFLEIDMDFLPENKLMEEEADYFAASFLAPFFAIARKDFRRPAEIRDFFGLSQTAAEYRWNEYVDFLRLVNSPL